MTVPTLIVDLNYAELSNIIDNIGDLRNVAMSVDEKAYLDAFEAKVQPLFEQAHLMEIANKVYEDDRIILWAHPDDPDDNKSLMGYLKEAQHFEEDTGEYEPDEHTASVIVETMLSAFVSEVLKQKG